MFAADLNTTEAITAKELLLQHFLEEGYLVLPPDLRFEKDGDRKINHDAIYAQASRLFQNDLDPGNNILPQIPELYHDIFSAGANIHLDAALRLILGKDYLFHSHRRCHDTVPGRLPQGWHKDTYKGRQYQPNHAPVEWVMAMYYPQTVTLDLGPTELWPGSQYYRGDYGVDSETQRQQWSIHKHKSVTCPKGSIVLIHFDIWHRAAMNKCMTNDNVISQRFMFKFQFARMTFSTNNDDERISTTTNSTLGKEDEYIYSQILAVQDAATKRTTATAAPIATSGVRGATSTTTQTEEFLDMPKFLQGIREIQAAGRSDLPKVRGKLLKRTVDEIMTAMQTKNNYNDLVPDKKLRKELLATLSSKIDSLLDEHDRERTARQFATDRMAIWNHARWCYGYNNHEPSPQTERGNSDKNDAATKAKNLVSPCENVRLAAAYQLATTGAEGVKILLDMLTMKGMEGNTITTPQRRNIAYGLIAACREGAEKQTGSLVIDTMEAWLEENVFKATVETLLGDSSSASGSLPMRHSISNGDEERSNDSNTTSGVRRAVEGFDLEFSKEATDKHAELHYCIVFILAISAFAIRDEASQIRTIRLLLADCINSIASDDTIITNEANKMSVAESCCSIRCVAVEGLGRWLSTGRTDNNNTNCGNFDTERQVALNLIAYYLESPREDLRCAASLALARCPLGMIESTYGRFHDIIVRTLNMDPCRYVRSYIFEALTRCAAARVNKEPANGCAHVHDKELVESLRNHLVNIQSSRELPRNNSPATKLLHDPIELLNQVANVELDYAVRTKAARELTAYRWCDLTTSKNRW